MILMHQTLKKRYKLQYFLKNIPWKRSALEVRLPQIITEGEWEYVVVQYAANGNKTNVASI